MTICACHFLCNIENGVLLEMKDWKENNDTSNTSFQLGKALAHQTNFTKTLANDTEIRFYFLRGLTNFSEFFSLKQIIFSFISLDVYDKLKSMS